MAKKKKDTKPLKPADELFCQYYAGDSEYFNNATWAFIAAFKIPIPIKPSSSALHYSILRRRYDQTINKHAVRANMLLRNIKIRKRCDQILMELFSDAAVDKEHSRVIRQNKDPNAKMRAITEYNKLKSRVKDTVEGNFTIKWKE